MPNNVVDYVLLTALVAAALATVITARLLLSAIGLALTSAILTVIMFRLDSPLAAVFELSVCAGLIPAILISAITLTRRLGPEDLKARRLSRLRRYWFLPIIVVLVAFALGEVGLVTHVVASTQPPSDVRTVLWNLRRVDLLGQIVILLAAAFAVVVLLKERPHAS